MCNLYTYKLSRDEIRGLMQHYKLVGQQWAEVFEQEMIGKNDEALVYPKYQAPVVTLEGKCRIKHCWMKSKSSSTTTRASGTRGTGSP
jgi:hypothetical protein